ncbi:unnamed protein product [Peronospora destructor]|uniref:Uncharacterized protein n=1 Tax=Peronospora destructor TaxID=86335 RepID=A0AAV0VFZ0_9STRA|nr:unnamed protein product [Peronospora destructor]
MDKERPKAFVSNQSHSHGDAHVTWDEKTIALHDLDRGTRIKIDEPNTPYHYYREGDEVGKISPARSFSGECPMQWDELQSKLQEVKDKKDSEWNLSHDTDLSSASGGLDFATRDSEGKKIHKDPNFADKRKSHYNEFERVRAWKMQNAAEHDEDEAEKESEEKRTAPSQ